MLLLIRYVKHWLEWFAMKILYLKALVIISMMGLVQASIALSEKYHQEFYAVDKYVMPEPFSSEPLIPYSMITTNADT